jgi:hypothetical protein
VAVAAKCTGGLMRYGWCSTGPSSSVSAGESAIRAAVSSQQRAVQDGEVPRGPGDAVSAQADKGPGDGPAHEGERRAVRGQADGVGSAADQGRRDAGDEGRVVGEPPPPAPAMSIFTTSSRN